MAHPQEFGGIRVERKGDVDEFPKGKPKHWQPQMKKFMRQSLGCTLGPELKLYLGGL